MDGTMTKRQLIDQIMELNRSAQPGFLSQFSDGQLGQYLGKLRQVFPPPRPRRPRRRTIQVPIVGRTPRPCPQPAPVPVAAEDQAASEDLACPLFELTEH